MSTAVYLFANFHYYDYIHKIELKNGGECEFVDGAGQGVNAAPYGTYEHTKVDSEHGSIHFEFDEKEFEIPYKIETGRWLFRQEVVWNQKEETWPIHIATKRWVFNYDPISAFYEARKHNIYYTLENVSVDGDPSEKVYYDYEFIEFKIPFNTLSEADQALVTLKQNDD